MPKGGMEVQTPTLLTHDPPDLSKNVIIFFKKSVSHIYENLKGVVQSVFWRRAPRSPTTTVVPDASLDNLI